MYLYGMFVRKKKNRSGTVSVVVADKSSGKFKELKTIGVSSDPDEIVRLEVRARQWIDEYSGQQRLDFDESSRALQEARNTIARIERTLQNTPQVILGRIYDSIGFGAIGDSILRHRSGTASCATLSLRGYASRRARLRRWSI